MQDRETALKEQENAREWQAIAYGDHPATWAALAYYRERGWPVDANTFPERDRCENRIFAFKAGYAAALASPFPAPPQEPTGASPQAEELRAANVANLREMVGMAGRYRETLLAVRECILALSPGHRTGYDWNADPLFLTLKEGRALNLIDDALKATPASPQAEPSRCAETCGLLRCRLNEGHSGLHQVYNAATGDFQQFIGQLAPVSPVEPAGSPTTAHVAPIVGKVWTHHDGVLPDGSVCRTADVDALIAERTAQLQAALFDEQASHEATKCRLVAAEQSHEAAGNRVIELLKSTPVEPAGASPQADVTCEHGTAMDVHCCNCHSGFIFDVNHECPAPELTWREAVEQALGVENDPENHTPSWAFDVVRAAREIGNAPTPASPQAEMTQCDYCHTWRSRPCGEGCCWQPASLAPVEPTPEPETCEWTRRGDYFVASCKSPRSSAAPDSIVGWKGCPYCLKPLRLVPSEEPK